MNLLSGSVSPRSSSAFGYATSADKNRSNGAPLSSCAYKLPDDPYDTVTSTAREPVNRGTSSPRAVLRSEAAAIVSISGRNQLRGYVDEIRVEGLLAQVRLRIGDQMLTAVITRDAVEELKLRRGDDALAIVKATEVMVAREAEPRTRQRHR